MSRLYVQSEGTAARRRFPVYLVDATDGITPETGETGGQPQISKVGGAWSNTTATLTAIGNGAYYVELTASELDTLGSFQIRFKSANTAEFNMDGEVVAINIHDAVRAGLTALPNVNSGSAGAIITSGTGTAQLSVSGGRANADVTHWSTVAVATPDSTGYPKVTLKTGTGAGELSIASGVVSANVTQFGGSAGTFASGRPEVNTTHVGGTVQTARDLGASVLLSPGTGVGQIALTNGQVTVGTNTDKSGYALSASGNSAVWDFLTSSIDDVGSIGLMIKTNLDTTVSSRLATAGYTAPDNATIGIISTNVTSLLNRIGAFTGSGVNTILGMFRALLSKTATTPSDVGGTFDPSTDSTEAIRDRGDAAWVTGSFSTITAADVWTYGTRVLTAGTNIVLTKGTGVTGFNDVSSAYIDGRTLPSDQYATATEQTTQVGYLIAIKSSTDALTGSSAEPSSVPAANATLLQKVGWLFALGRNKIMQTATTQTLRNDADSNNIGTAGHSDDGTTYTRNEWQ